MAIGLIIYGAMFLYAVVMLVQIIWAILAWLWGLLIEGPRRRAVHQEIVEKARRGRLTAAERERRLRAIYPIPWVERARWPVSRRP